MWKLDTSIKQLYQDSLGCIFNWWRARLSPNAYFWKPNLEIHNPRCLHISLMHFLFKKDLTSKPCLIHPPILHSSQAWACEEPNAKLQTCLASGSGIFEKLLFESQMLHGAGRLTSKTGSWFICFGLNGGKNLPAPSIWDIDIVNDFVTS